MSPRTLQRRLREEGTSWRAEMEEARRSRVERLLREPSMTLEVIAVRADYTARRALRRAIHRWYGYSPGEARAAARSARQPATYA